MNTATINFQQNINPEFDNYAISQLLILYAAPHKKESPKHTIGDLEKLLNEIVSNRGFFEGNSRQRGEHEILIKEAINTNQELNDLYPTRHHFRTQFEKVITIIDYIGHHQFTEKALLERFQDKNTAGTIRNMYLQAIEKNKDNTLKKGKKRQQREFAGTIDKMAETKIDVDLLIHQNFDLQKQLKFPLAFLIKYGKSAESAAKKIGEYVADKIIDIHNKAKVNDVNIFNYDPGLALSYAIIQGKNALKEPAVQAAFGIDEKNDPGTKQARTYLEQLIDYAQTKKKAEEEKKKIPQGQKIPMDKNTNKYVQYLLNRGAQFTKQLDENHKDSIMLGFYLQAGSLGDIRGISVVKQNGITGAPHFQTNKYFKQGSAEQHNEEANKGKRKYHSEHAKFYTRMLERQDPKRWAVIKEKRLIEGQKVDISGLILDLLGPDNRIKYGDSKQHTKYNFNDDQDRLRDQMEKRILWLAEPVDEALELLLDTIRKNPTQDTYQQELTACAAYVHERLYGK